MAAEMYSQYFGTPEPPIHVGARRFPIREVFVEELKAQLSLSSKCAKLAQDVYNFCEKTKCSTCLFACYASLYTRAQTHSYHRPAEL